MPKQTREAAIDAHIQNDGFGRFLGADVAIVAPGHSRVSLTVTDQMTNFHGITHGGLVFSLGDLAFAAARISVFSTPPRWVIVWWPKPGSAT